MQEAVSVRSRRPHGVTINESHTAMASEVAEWYSFYSHKCSVVRSHRIASHRGDRYTYRRSNTWVAEGASCVSRASTSRRRNRVIPRAASLEPFVNMLA